MSRQSNIMDRNNVVPNFPVEIENVKSFVSSNLSILSKLYAENMPDWVLAKYFDPFCLERKQSWQRSQSRRECHYC